MAIVRRLSRLCRADLHGMLDQLEDKELLLKQLLRDMEADLARKEGRIRRMSASRDQARRDLEKQGKEQARIEGDLAAAVERNRDDIARFLIRKLKPVERHREALRALAEALEAEIAGLQATVGEQRLQAEQIRLRAREFGRGAEGQRQEEMLSSCTAAAAAWEPSEEEVELELLRRKETAQGGNRP